MIDPTILGFEARFKAVRSRGPGGQNVNKVSSAAVLYWDYQKSRHLTDEQKARLAARLANHISANGEIFVRSDEFRDLERNKSRCLFKLANLIAAALHTPKKRKATTPSRAARRRRLETKRRHGETKAWRRKVKD